MRNKLKLYYRLTKPGIIYGNDISAASGFLLASGLANSFNIWLMLATLAGTSLVIACGCVINNYIDRDIDKKMARTKKRAIVSGEISGRSAITYGITLGMLGFLILIFFTNWLVVAIGAIGLFSYLVLYSIGKRGTVHGTLIGSISGSTPIVAGYCAVAGSFDMAALLLFLSMAFWQMPHFYAIAMYRSKDYASAGLPVLPVKKGALVTKIQILIYIAIYALAVAQLTFFAYTGYTFLIIMLAVSLYWFYKGIKGFKTEDSSKWGRGMFGFSLIVLLTFSALLSLEWLLP
jgi:protoheme IX farnesyltransferase